MLHRRWFANLITNLVKEGKYDKARKALDKCAREIPAYNVPHDVNSASLEIAQAYIECQQSAKAVKILEQLEKRCLEYATWYLSLNDTYFQHDVYDCAREVHSLGNILYLYRHLSESPNVKGDRYAKKAQLLSVAFGSLSQGLEDRCNALGIPLR